MTVDWDAVEQLQGRAETARKRGDRLRGEGDEAGAMAAFGVAEASLRECLTALGLTPTPETASARAETLGSLGGILRRMNRSEEAFENYSEGADIEQKYHLPSTYNRVNSLKHKLLTGKKTLSELESEIRTTAKALSDSLNDPRDQRAADSAWSWADLGDCLTLLGDFDSAERAYTIFIKKASLKSPETTLDVLKSIARAIAHSDEAGAKRVNDAVAFLESQLVKRYEIR